MRVGESVEHLGGSLDRARIIERSLPQGLAEGLARHVLVGDVDVALVTLDRVRADAAGIAELRDREGLSLGALPGLALAGDDLESDVAVLDHVPGEPHGA